MAVKTASQKSFRPKLQNKGHKINQMADLQRKTEKNPENKTAGEVKRLKFIEQIFFQS